MERLLVNGINKKTEDRIDRYRRLAHRHFFCLLFCLWLCLPLRPNWLWSICCGDGVASVENTKWQIVTVLRHATLCLYHIIYFITISNWYSSRLFFTPFQLHAFARFMAIDDIDTPKLLITTALKMVRWHRFHCVDTSTSIHTLERWRVRARERARVEIDIEVEIYTKCMPCDSQVK